MFKPIIALLGVSLLAACTQATTAPPQSGSNYEWWVCEKISHSAEFYKPGTIVRRGGPTSFVVGFPKNFQAEQSFDKRDSWDRFAEKQLSKSGCFNSYRIPAPRVSIASPSAFPQFPELQAR